MKRIAVAIGGLLISGVLAAESQPAKQVLPGLDRNECLSTTFIRERRVLDSRRIVIWSGTTAYLIELGRPLQGLDRGSNAIHFVDGDRDGQLCRTVRDGVILDDTLLPQRTHAAGIVRLGEDELRTLEAQYEVSLKPKRVRGRSADAY